MILNKILFPAIFSVLISPSLWAMTANQAAHFLNQATFGATQSDINDLVALGDYEAWIDAQMAMPRSAQQEPYVRARADKLDRFVHKHIDTQIPSRHDIWWNTIVNGRDQLRHRMAYALSQIFVISEQDQALKISQYGMANYYDMLADNAFGNFRELLEDVTLHPTMGLYLSMLRNEKAVPERNIRPDENYAREIMQLFTIGMHYLNRNGSVWLDANHQPLPSYTEKDIRAFAKVFTGWNFDNHKWNAWWGRGDRTKPMVAEQRYHDTSRKKLLRGTILPAGQSAEKDMEGALDNLFEHPNVEPFIARLLIQRFVTSNPAPGYISRVAAVFRDNGLGERGNLAAVIKAVLLDKEAMLGAKKSPNTFGKLREPAMRLAHILRAFDGRKVDGGEFNRYPGTMVFRFPFQLSYGLEKALGQTLLAAPSVFNFYLPDYSPPGVLQDELLLAPEFQISNENTQAGSIRIINSIIQRTEINPRRPLTTLNLAPTIAIGRTGLDNLLDHLDTVLCGGSLTHETRAIILRHLLSSGFKVPELAGNNNPWPDYDKTEWQVRDAITLIVNSPDYLVQQ